MRRPSARTLRRRAGGQPPRQGQPGTQQVAAALAGAETARQRPHAAPELQADRGASRPRHRSRSYCFPAWLAGSRPQ